MQVRKDCLPEVTRVIKETMESADQYLLSRVLANKDYPRFGVPLKVKLRVRDNWGQLEDYEPPAE